jgi:phospholipase C
VKTQEIRHGRAVVAVSGTHSVTLAMGWPERETQDMLGFAIKRRTSTTEVWLPVVLQFAGKPSAKGKLYPSNESPIQSMVWNDLGLSDDKRGRGLAADTEYSYEVIPVRGTPEALRLDQTDAVTLTIRTEPQIAKQGASVWFNRGLSDSQEYERLFGEDHQPEGDDEAMAWLARGLDEAIIGFIVEAIEDETLQLDAAVYHLDHPGVIDALTKLGKRCRVSMDWGDEEGDLSGPYAGPNGPAYKQLIAAGVSVHQRQHVAISHNKYLLLKDSQGTPQAVLTGSTNFTRGGISTQSNQSVILRDPSVAAAYLKDFELVLNNDNDGLRAQNAKGTIISDTLEVYFSPHHSSDTPDLDRFKAIATAAKSSVLFMTFRMTAIEVVQEILNRGITLGDGVLVCGVADRVYQGNDASGDRLLYDDAFTDDPRVACAADPLDDLDSEPDEQVLFDELKRQGYDPLIHHKLLICDWDTPDCVVVTGSANYSTNSSKNNDENSLLIRGDQRLAQAYFAEFARLYTHWRPRWLHERNYKHGHTTPVLAADASWAQTWYAGGRNAQLLQLALGDAAAQIRHVPDEAAVAAEQALIAKAGERMQHLIVLMLENRSFDHMLGFLPGVDGVLNASGEIEPARYNYANPVDPTSDKYTVAKAQFFAIPEEDQDGEYGGPSHSYPAATQQLFGQKYRSQSDPGSDPVSNNGFIINHINELKYSQKIADPKPEHIRVAIDCFAPDQLPVIHTLAQEFAVCDQWFSEVPGPTEPNRLFTQAATSIGLTHNVWDLPISARTIQENLAEQGHTWAFYYHDLSDSNQFPALKSQPDNVRPFAQFYTDLAQGSALPSYSFLCPRYADTATDFANSQHAPFDVRYGEHLIADVYEAVRRSPNWDKTVLIITYDEHGGFYDHVTPPRDGVANPDGLTSPTANDRQQAAADPDKYGYLIEDDYNASFQRLGCRVPTVVVSPWIARGTVDSTRYQHTSIAATLKQVFGLPAFLTKRDAQANVLTALLAQGDQLRHDAPLKVPRPPLPGEAASEPTPIPGQRPLNVLQKGIYSTLAQLDGHPDSGKPPPIHATAAEASDYIKARYAAHDKFHRDRKKSGRFEIYQDKSSEWRWRLRDAANLIVASSGEGMKTKAEVEAEIASIRDLAPRAAKVDLSKVQKETQR